uniref:Uncharacterized protein n=1 Tax=Arundo donax TaxID=35708 RepID=A0A0A9CJ32_ARUDO
MILLSRPSHLSQVHMQQNPLKFLYLGLWHLKEQALQFLHLLLCSFP